MRSYARTKKRCPTRYIWELFSRPLQEVKRVVIERNIDVNYIDPETHEAPVHVALDDEKKDLFEFLLDFGGGVNLVDLRQDSLLHRAIASQSIECLRVILQHSANFLAKNAEGETALSRAAYEWIRCLDLDDPERTGVKFAQVKILLEEGARINSWTSEIDVYRDYCALVGAILADDVPEVQHITDHLLDVDFYGIDEISPLAYAVFLDRPRIVELLLDRDANMNARVCWFGTPLFDLIVKRDLGAIEELFVTKGFDLKGYIEAAKRTGDVGLIRSLIARYHIDLESQNPRGRTMLQEMVILTKEAKYSEKNKYLGVIDFLVNAGANVQHRDKMGDTVLHHCGDFCAGGDVLCRLFAFFLLHGGEDSVLQNYRGDIPQHTCEDLYELCTVFKYLRKLYLLRPEAESFRIFSTLRFESCKIVWDRFKNEKNKYFRETSKEIERLKGIRISDNTKYSRKKSLYDFLFLEANLVARCSRRQALIDRIESRDFRKQFTKYGFMIIFQFRKGQRRTVLMDEARRVILFITKRKIPVECIELILSYFSEFEIFRLIAMNPCEGVPYDMNIF